MCHEVGSSEWSKRIVRSRQYFFSAAFRVPVCGCLIVIANVAVRLHQWSLIYEEDQGSLHTFAHIQSLSSVTSVASA